MYKAFCGSRGSRTKSDKLLEVIESSSAKAEEYKLENDRKKKTFECVKFDRSEVARLLRPALHLFLKATFTAGSVIQPDL